MLLADNALTFNFYPKETLIGTKIKHAMLRIMTLGTAVKKYDPHHAEFILCLVSHCPQISPKRYLSEHFYKHFSSFDPNRFTDNAPLC